MVTKPHANSLQKGGPRSLLKIFNLGISFEIMIFLTKRQSYQIIKFHKCSQTTFFKDKSTKKTEICEPP